jgi:hypothetical protein
MTTMELEAQKAELARHILNIDNMEVMQEIKKSYNRTMMRMERRCKARTEAEQKHILNSIEQGLKDVREGNTRPLEELLNELNHCNV